MGGQIILGKESINYPSPPKTWKLTFGVIYQNPTAQGHYKRLTTNCPHCKLNENPWIKSRWLINGERKRQSMTQQPLCQINIGLHLVTLVSGKIYNTMSVTKLSLPGKSLQQRFVVMNVTLSNWYWDVYKNGPQPQLGGPITPWWAPTTHMVTMPICVYKYYPSGNVNKVTQDPYQFCYIRGSNVMTMLTQRQHYSSTSPLKRL